MLELMFGLVLVVAGVIAFTSANKLSAFEKRIADSHSWTKVTGWSGTRKGALAWRGVGLLLLLCGAVWTLGGLSSLSIGR